MFEYGKIGFLFNLLFYKITFFRTQSLASANSAILDGLKKRRSFLMNLEGIEKTIHNGKTLTRSSLLQLTPVMNV